MATQDLQPSSTNEKLLKLSAVQTSQEYPKQKIKVSHFQRRALFRRLPTNDIAVNEASELKPFQSKRVLPLSLASETSNTFYSPLLSE
jgi:hypothetical protein